MESNELMIGDWVKTSEGFATVLSIAEDGIYFKDNVSEGACSFDYVIPIPITLEILEKNGFKFDGSGQCSMMFLSEPRFSEGQRFNIYVGLKHKTIEVFVAHPIEKSPNWRKTNKAYLEVCGPSFHELQHALRLVGITKEITL